MIRTVRNRLAPLMAVAAICSSVALAWGPTGHRVVAEIAQRNLTPRARQRVAEVLRGHTLAEVVNWPDELRSDPRFDKYKLLHFATVPNGVSSYRDSNKARCGDLVVAIDALSAFLKSGSREALFTVPALTDMTDGSEKGACNPVKTDPITPDTALRLLAHFMGDLHQPLHVGGNDFGGNAVQVSWMDRWQTNLHSSWDDEMVDYERLSFTEYADFLNHLSDAEVTARQKGDTIAWADEAVAARPALYVFPDKAKNPKIPLISYGYIGAQRDRMREQLLKGGLRLAAVLNGIFE